MRAILFFQRADRAIFGISQRVAKVYCLAILMQSDVSKTTEGFIRWTDQKDGWRRFSSRKGPVASIFRQSMFFFFFSPYCNVITTTRPFPFFRSPPQPRTPEDEPNRFPARSQIDGHRQGSYIVTTSVRSRWSACLLGVFSKSIPRA